MYFTCTSVTLNSLTRTAGDSIAHCRAQPRLTASSWLSVVLGVFLKIFSISCLIAGILDDPPTISTEWISSIGNPINRRERLCLEKIENKRWYNSMSCSTMSNYVFLTYVCSSQWHRKNNCGKSKINNQYLNYLFENAVRAIGTLRVCVLYTYEILR